MMQARKMYRRSYAQYPWSSDNSHPAPGQDHSLSDAFQSPLRFSDPEQMSKGDINGGQ
jgi:hypothetical protein